MAAPSTDASGRVYVGAIVSSTGIAELQSTGRLTLDLPISPPNFTTEAFHKLEARLYNGPKAQKYPLAQASLIATFAGAPMALRNEFEVTAPYLLRPGSVSRFGFAFANADPENASHVTQIKIEQPEGKPLFANAKAVELAGGSTTGRWNISADNRTIWWNSTDPRGVEVRALHAADWWVDIVASNNTTRFGTGIRAPRPDYWNATLRFEETGYETTAWRWGSGHPWIVTAEVPPEDPLNNRTGYATAPGLHTFTATMNGAPAVRPGRGEYRVLPGSGNSVAGLKAALAKSHLTVSDYDVPLGERLQVTADFQAVLKELAGKGVTQLAYTFKLFSPPGLVTGRPSLNFTVPAESLPLQPLRALSAGDVTGDGVPELAAASGNGNVYLREGATRRELWGSPDGAPGAVVFARLSGEPAAVLLSGHASGEVQRHDPVTGANSVVASAGTGRRVTALRVVETASGEASRIYVEFQREQDAPGEGGFLILDGAGNQEAALTWSLVPASGGRNLAVGNFSPPGGAPRPGGAFLSLGSLEAFGADGSRLWSLDPSAADPLQLCTVPRFVLPWEASGSSGTRLLVFLENPASRETCIAAWDHEGAPVGGFRGTTLPSPLAFAAITHGLGAPTTTSALVLAGASGELEIYHWSDAGLAWRRTASWRVVEEVAVDSWNPTRSLVCQTLGQKPVPLPALPRGTLEVDPFETYRVCMQVTGERTTGIEGVYSDRSAPVVTALLVTPDFMAVGYTYEAAGHVALYTYPVGGSSRGTHYDVELPGATDAAGPTSLLLYSDTALGGPLLLAAGSDGHLVAMDPATGDVVWTEEVGDSLGRFSFNVHVPLGGLFGAHLVVAELSWTNPAGANPPQDLDLLKQAARLVAPFIVVDQDGREVLDPVYTVVLLQWERGER
ncbi:MAG TPA: hypothetical protein VNZ52_09475 [Candidatus Thermoplasmatota archaeon]|nr:hypothetical protein [Candidatus Thermoplasmatota archaeon]